MSTTMILKKHISQDFTVVHNEFLKDMRLGINSRGLLITMLSLPEDWKFSIKGLQKILPDGQIKITTALSELENCGYVRRRRLYNEKGKVYAWEYRISDEHIFENEPLKLKKSKENLNNQEKSHGLQLENLNVEKLNKENLHLENLNNNQISNKSNTNLSNTNQSVYHRAENEKNQKNEKSEIDRPTDRLPQKTISFSEVLSEINYHDRFMPKSEKDCYEPSEAIKSCSIPYSFKEDKKALKKALTFLFGFNYYSEGMEEQDKDLFAQVITLLTELATTDKSKVSQCYVKYHEVIDKLNELIANNMLYDWFFSFIPEWNTICQERKIKNVRAYLKSCIWSWLNEYKIVENSLSRSIPSNSYSSNTSEIHENASEIDFNDKPKEIYTIKSKVLL